MFEENSETESVKSTKSDSVLVKARRGRKTNAERLGLQRKDIILKNTDLKSNKSDTMAKSGEVKIGIESLADYLKRKFNQLNEKIDAQVSSLNENKKKIDRIENLEKKIDGLRKDLKGMIVEELDKVVKNTKEVIREELKDEMKKEISKQLKDVKISNNNENVSENVMKTVYNNEMYIEKLERENKRNNIIIVGIEAEIGNLKKELVKWIAEDVKANVEAESGRKIKDGMYLLKLKSQEDKERVMRNSYTLKGTNIYIKDDLTYKEREFQKKLVDFAREQKEENKDAYIKIRYKKVWVNEDLYVWDEKEKKIVMVENDRERVENKEIQNRPKN